MLTGKFCFHCGGALDANGSDMDCLGCGAVYSNILLSETEFQEEGHDVLEIGFTADIMVRTPQIPEISIEVPEPQLLSPTSHAAEAAA